MSPVGHVADIIDSALEFSVVGSFTRIGPAVRRRIRRWQPIPDGALRGRVVILTGATSGLGAAAAVELARLGADLHIVGRDPERTQASARRIRRAADATEVTPHIADLADLAAVREFSHSFLADHDRLDVLIHNAGALDNTFATGPDGHEVTYTAQVLGPFRMTSLLLPIIPAGGRVITVSSGGMYTQRLVPDRVQMSADRYDGVEAYARAKRAQVELTGEWARRHADTGVAFWSMHPGWADTPGVRTSLPTFRRITGPLLRDAAAGADTIVWLAASPRVDAANGAFFLDRAPRATHRLPNTRTGPAEAQQLWAAVAKQVGATAASV